MTKILLFSILILPFFGQSQDITISIRPGLVIGETENFKKHMSFFNRALAISFPIGVDFNLQGEVGLSKINFYEDDFNGNTFNTRNLLFYAARLKYNNTLNRNTTLYIEAGPSLHQSYQLKSERFYNGAKSTVKQTITGLNIAANVNVGCRLRLKPKIRAELGFFLFKELGNNYAEQNPYKIKIEGVALQTGLSFLL